MATIEFVNVTKSYPGAASPAVNDVSFTVREGAICMLLGTSGSGKTTLLRMVNRLIDPTSGEIRLDGTPTIAALIGGGGFGVFVFQGVGQTAMDLVLLGALPTVALAFAAAIVLDAVIEITATRRRVETA